MLDHARLVHLIRDLGDNDRFAILAEFLNGSLRPKLDTASSASVVVKNSRAAENDSPRWKIGAQNDRQNVGQSSSRILNQLDRRFDNLSKIVRRNVGRHADGD